MGKIQMDRNGYYAYISPIENTDYEHISLILDTNVAINVERFYYKPNKQETNKKQATVDFLIDNLGSDLIDGFAKQEACWDYSIKRLNQSQYEKMENALDKVFSWSKDEIIAHIDSPGIVSEHELNRAKPPMFTTLIDQVIKCNPFILNSYISVLKIMILQKKLHGKLKDKKKCVEEYVEFVNTVHAVNCGLENYVAINYFLGKDESYKLGNKLFKFDVKDENMLLRAMNISWDFFFLRLLQNAYLDKVDYLDAQNPKLITRDDGLINLAELCSLEASMDNNINIFTFFERDLRPEYINFMESIEKKLYFGSVDRRIKQDLIKKENEYLMNLARQLEEEILKL
jgi:hypothetical protein